MNAVRKVLKGKDPGRFVYAPNYWQWFAHHRNHGLLPAELEGIDSQLALINWLNLDVFSRNIYCDEQQYWFGGILSPVWDEPVRFCSSSRRKGRDVIHEKSWTTPAGALDERLRYAWSDSTLEQEAFMVKDVERQGDAVERWLEGRRFEVNGAFLERQRGRTPADGVICAGEVFSPLKMLHLIMGPQQATFFLMDEPERARRWMDMHHRQMMDALRKMLAAGVESVMAMDNLDTMFHPPQYVRQYSAGFYEEAAAFCHSAGATFWIHACGQQRANLELIASLGVDGLEGVAYPPLGDVSLREAFELTGDRFMMTGGISAMEFEKLKSREAVFGYIRRLFDELRPFRHRFMLSASCNTPINARWEQICWFRDAWQACLQ